MPVEQIEVVDALGITRTVRAAQDLATLISATNTGIASVLAKITADPATQTTLAAVLAKLTADPATQTTLAALLAKVIAAPATEAKQDTGNTSLAGLRTDITTTLAAYVDGIEALLGTTNAKDFATQTTLVSIDSKIADLKTYTDGLEALASALNGYVDGLETLVTATNTALAAATPAGTNIIGKIGLDQTTPGTTNATVSNAAAAAGGVTTTARLASAAATTNATNVKTSAGRIFGARGINKAAYEIFLVLYDSTANPPVPGTTTIRMKIPLPAASAFTLLDSLPCGYSFATGIGYAFTKLAADADTTVLVAADILGFNLDYV